jgi:hypothetical protein
MNRDFDAYAKLHASRGSRLGKIASGYAASQLSSSRYQTAGIGDLQDAPIEQQIRYLWQNPGPRQAVWERVDAAAATAGRDYDLGQNFNSGFRGQMSLFQPMAGELALIVEAQDGKIPVAWIEFPVEYPSGVIQTRLTFGWVDSTQLWYPLRMDVAAATSDGPMPIF